MKLAEFLSWSKSSNWLNLGKDDEFIYFLTPSGLFIDVRYREDAVLTITAQDDTKITLKKLSR